MVTPDPNHEWLRLEAALDELLDLQPRARLASLRQWEVADSSFHARLLDLLRYCESGSDWLDQPAIAAVAEPLSCEPVVDALEDATVVGPYRIVKLLGRGGAGEVYAAQRADGSYQQQVALKVIRRDAIEHRDQFEAERQILAGLNHPHIARLLDGGVTAGGQPYMVMELVDGLPLMAWCRTHAADLSTRLRLFQQICSAVIYAHRHLIVHRDLKPGNVFVTADAEVKLLDFGAAKLLGRQSAENTRNAPFTPGYAAPEQLKGLAVTTSTDGYALGLLLFELLTDTPPFRLDTLSMAGALDAVLHREAPALSEFAQQLTAAPIAPRELRGDLQAIVSRALRKDPAHRYTTVSELLDDVQASIECRPVKARGGALTYLIGRSLRRHKGIAASALTIVLAIAVAALGIEHQARRAQAEALKEAAVKSFLLDIFHTNSVDNPDGASARQTTAEQLLDRGAKVLSTGATSRPEVRAELSDDLADLYDQLEDFDRVEQLERQRLRDLAREDPRPSLPRAMSLAMLGRALAMNGRYAEARQTLQDALRDLDALHDDRAAARSLALMMLGLVEYHTLPATDPGARRHAQEALDLLAANQPRNPDRLTALQLVARIDERRGARADAEQGYRAFLQLAQTPPFRGQRAALGSAYDDLGDFLIEEHRYEEAAVNLTQAVRILAEAEGRDQTGARMARQDLAKLYLSTGQYQAAEPLLRDNHVYYQHHADDDRGMQAATESGWARCELALGRLQEAQRAQAQATRLYTHIGSADSEAGRDNAVTAADIAVARGQWQLASQLYLPLAASADQGFSRASARARLGLGQVLLHQRHARGAAAQAQQVLRQIAMLAPARRPLDLQAGADQMAARAAVEMHDYAAAAMDLRDAIQASGTLAPGSSPALVQLRHALTQVTDQLNLKVPDPAANRAVAAATRHAL